MQEFNDKLRSGLRESENLHSFLDRDLGQEEAAQEFGPDALLCSTDSQTYVRMADMEFRGYTSTEIISMLTALQAMSEALATPDAVRYRP